MSALERVESAVRLISPSTLGDEVIALARKSSRKADDEAAEDPAEEAAESPAEEAAEDATEPEKAEAKNKLGGKFGQYMALRKKGMPHGPAMKACAGGS